MAKARRLFKRFSLLFAFLRGGFGSRTFFAEMAFSAREVVEG
jgi:hypothetical protein